MEYLSKDEYNIMFRQLFSCPQSSTFRLTLVISFFYTTPMIIHLKKLKVKVKSIFNFSDVMKENTCFKVIDFHQYSHFNGMQTVL